MDKLVLCELCKKPVVITCTPANDNKKPKVVIVACDEQLKRKSHYRRLGVAYSNLSLSRRSVPDFAHNVICKFLEADGKIYRADGKVFVYEDEAIENSFNDELTFRWISDLFRTALGDGPKQMSQRRVLSRMRLLDLALRIEHPEIAAKIAK